MVEFKFNAICVQDTPQFVSPMKPSQYLDSSYEEYYYDNYITKLSLNFNIEIPKREEYLKTIHAPNPECMKLYQEKYYKGCKNSSKYSGEEDDINSYKTALKLSKESIKNFITTNNLKHDKMTQYLLDTQKNKCYMLYKKGKLYYQTKNLDDYIITEVVKDEKRSRYKAKTKSGRTLKILLRWKNGNGIAFPSFQIS